MTTANKITVLRILLIPVMLIVIEIPFLQSIDTNFLGLSLAQLLFACIFILAAATDFLDGYIARKYHQITTFGKFLDPIADKMLVFVALFYLMIQKPNLVPLWTVAVILIREFAVTGIRLLAVGEGKVIAASIYGKAKTMTTMFAIVVLLFNNFAFTSSMEQPMGWIAAVIYYIAVLLTVISGLDYFWKNRKVVLESI